MSTSFFSFRASETKLYYVLGKQLLKIFLFSSLISQRSRKVLLFSEERLLQLPVLLFCADLPAHRLKRCCDLKAFLHLQAWVLGALGTGPDSFLLAAVNDMVAAPVVRLASRTGDLIVVDDLVPVSDSHPQLRGMMKLFLGLLKWWDIVSGT